MRNLLILAAVIAISPGCRSFKTTVLHRFSNDSVTPQKSNARLLGLPVKLKVPSHVLVTIYEEQVILANSPDQKTTLEGEAKTARVNVVAQQGVIKDLTTAIETAERDLASLKDLIRIARKQLDTPQSPPLSQEERNGIEKTITAATAKLPDAIKDLEDARLKKVADESKEIEKLAKLEAAATVAADKAAVGYTLISFNPAQFHVASELQYTDKVFLVDFKRPAGGVLNLTGATMDKEQYFSDVQAEVQERTLQDISAALNTAGGVIKKDSTAANATPVSADTPETQSNQSVSFQKSVVASKRFDIAECNWEREMQDFVSHHLGRPDLLQNAVEAGFATGADISSASNGRSESWQSDIGVPHSELAEYSPIVSRR
jgi:hypothetical protein